MPRSSGARALLGVATPLLAHGAADRFEEPSNPVFQAAEYVATKWRGASDSDSCEPGDNDGEAIARQVDSCIRANSSHSKLARVRPYTLEFKKLDGSWATFEHPPGCRADRIEPPPDSCWYKTFLDLERLQQKADTERKSSEEVIWESLTHEYAHHLVDEQHGDYFNSHLDRVRRGTYACDDE